MNMICLGFADRACASSRYGHLEQRIAGEQRRDQRRLAGRQAMTEPATSRGAALGGDGLRLLDICTCETDR
jgi:hypothetical protein